MYKREAADRAPTWVAHLTWLEGGKRRQSKRSFRTKKEAQSALNELLAAHRTGAFVPPSRLTVADYAQPWLDGLANQGRKASTLRGYRGIVHGKVVPALGDIVLQELSAKDLDALYAALLRSGLSMTTVRQVHAVLGKMLHDAERKGLVPRNVSRLANAPSMAAARSRGPEIRVWSPTELSTFLTSIAGNRNEAMLRLLAMTGLRRSEVIGLRWSDVQFEHRRLTVNQAAVLVDGEEALDAPKTRRSRRVVDLDDETLLLLQRHRANQRERHLRLGVIASASDRVFTNDVGEPLRPDSVGQAFGRLVDAAGLPKIRLHDLRHTHASQLLMAGVNAKVVSERLGHASVSFTLDVYGHVMPGQQAAAAATAASLVAAPQPVR